MREPHDNDFTQAFGRVDGSFGWSDFTSTTSFLRHEITSRYDATSALPLFSVASATPSPFDDTTVIRMWTEEMRLNSRQGSKIKWLSGLFASTGSSSQDATLTTPSVGGPAIADYREAREDQILELALFGDVYIPLSRALTIGGGLRWFASLLEVESRVAQPPLASMRAFNGKLGASGVAPKLDITYRPWQSMMFYAQVAEGYRIGGFNTSGLVTQPFGAIGGGAQPFLRYGKDELWNYEIGAKLALLDGRLHLRGAAFWDVWDNIQVDQLLPSGLLFTGNAGNAQNRGLEIEASYDLDSGLSLHANLIVNDPELVHADPTFPALTDTALPSVARVAGGLSMSYVRPLTSKLALGLDANINYVGTSHFTFGGVTGARMGGLINARLQASLESERWRLSTYLENPTDRSGNTFSYGNPFSLQSGAQFTPLRPRTIGFSLTRSF